MANDLNLRPAYKTIVYQEGGDYFARDSAGNLLQSMTPPTSIDGIAAFPFPNPGNDPTPLLQAALNRQGDIYVASGSYEFKNNFEGLRVRNFSRITLAKDANFVVPNGYSGSVFVFESVQATVLDGGFFTEKGGATNAKRRWTLIQFVGATGGNGCHSNLVQNIRSWFVGTVIHLDAVGEGGWVHSNKFSNFSVWAYRVGIKFAQVGDFKRNLFEQLYYQTHPDRKSETGARRISGQTNIFLNVSFYDAVVDGIERITQNVARINSDASSTLILGGIMTTPEDKFVDQGTNTQIIDELNVIVTT